MDGIPRNVFVVRDQKHLLMRVDVRAIRSQYNLQRSVHCLRIDLYGRKRTMELVERCSGIVLAWLR